MPANIRKKFLINKIEVSANSIVINDNLLDLTRFETAEQCNTIAGLSISSAGNQPRAYGTGTIDGWVGTIKPGDAVYFNGRDITDPFLSATPETTSDVLRIQRRGIDMTVGCKGDGEAFGVINMSDFDLFSDFTSKSSPPSSKMPIDRPMDHASTKEREATTNLKTVRGETVYNPTGSARGGDAYNTHGNAIGGAAYSGDPTFIRESLSLLSKFKKPAEHTALAQATSKAISDPVPVTHSNGKTYNHNKMDNVTYNDIEPFSIVKLSGMGNVVFNGLINEGVTMKISGMGNVVIRGEIHESVKIDYSGMGNLTFSRRPPQQVIDNIKHSGMGTLKIPAGNPRALVTNAPVSVSVHNVSGSGQVTINGDVHEDVIDELQKSGTGVVRSNDVIKRSAEAVGHANETDFSSIKTAQDINRGNGSPLVTGVNTRVIARDGIVTVFIDGKTTQYKGKLPGIFNRKLLIDGHEVTENDPRMITTQTSPINLNAASAVAATTPREYVSSIDTTINDKVDPVNPLLSQQSSPEPKLSSSSDVTTAATHRTGKIEISQPVERYEGRRPFISSKTDAVVDQTKSEHALLETVELAAPSVEDRELPVKQV